MDENVDSVKIVTEKQMPNGSVTLFLERCSDDKKHWKSPPLPIHVYDQESFRYRYVAKYKEGIVKAVATFLVSTFTGKKGDKTVQERHSRKLNKGMHQYDIFHDPSDHSRMRSVFVGQMFFVKLLSQELASGGNLKELLIECEHIGFGHPGYALEDVKWFLKWVEELVSNSCTPYQGVYLCSLLGQLVDRGRVRSAGSTSHFLGRKAVDLILSSFVRFPCTDLPHSSTKYIKIVAEDLFDAGSSKGCLSFIKYFCKLLDVNYVLQVADKRSSCAFSEKNFDQQLPDVLEALKPLKDTTVCSYLSYVIRCSPSVPCLWNLYQIMSLCFPGLLHRLTEEFSSIYGKFIECTRTRKPDLLQPLFWRQVPEQLKKKLANPFCRALADQLVSQTSWPKENLESLTVIVLDASLQSSDHFHHFILGVISHKCKEVVALLPDLLESKSLCAYWKTNISAEDKEKVCHHWLTTNYREAGARDKDKVLGVVIACETLCKADALKTDKALREAMDRKVEHFVFKTKFEFVMDAFKEAQSCAPVIQRRFIALLRNAIKQQSGTGDCRSRYRQMIHMLGFDASKERKKDLQKVKRDRYVKYL